MCIRDSADRAGVVHSGRTDLDENKRRYARDTQARTLDEICLLYTSDAADERSSVDLGGRRIIKKKNKTESTRRIHEIDDTGIQRP